MKRKNDYIVYAQKDLLKHYGHRVLMQSFVIIQIAMGLFTLCGDLTNAIKDTVDFIKLIFIYDPGNRFY